MEGSERPGPSPAPARGLTPGSVARPCQAVHNYEEMKSNHALSRNIPCKSTQHPDVVSVKTIQSCKKSPHPPPPREGKERSLGRNRVFGAQHKDRPRGQERPIWWLDSALSENCVQGTPQLERSLGHWPVCQFTIRSSWLTWSALHTLPFRSAKRFELEKNSARGQDRALRGEGLG